jgi:phosphoglycolate phosphatase-like HAD superfamily hydrolase
VDGTLALTEEVGDRCWAETVEAVLGIESPDTDWSHYRDVTDLGVTVEVSRRRRRRLPTPDEVARFRRRYAACIRRGLREEGSAGLVPGADAILRRLPAEGWRVALATGAWRANFLAKAAAAGLRHQGLPLATGDDDTTRVGIVRAAVAKASRVARLPGFARVVIVGDGVWDLRAARSLGHPFVGVTASGGAARLRAEGATALVRDFRDPDRFLRLLARASVPTAK